MRRRDLLSHVLQQGCTLLREGSRHSIYVNPTTNQTTSIPRHREINDFLARKICRDLGIPAPLFSSADVDLRGSLLTLTIRSS